MVKCVFCNVTNSKRNKILKNNSLTILLMANQRKVPGQVLVIPKRHIERFSEINEAEKDEIFRVIADTEKRLVSFYKSGCEVTQRYKPYIEDDDFAVSHLHFHLYPRQKDDALDRLRLKERLMHSPMTTLEVESMVNLFK